MPPKKKQASAIVIACPAGDVVSNQSQVGSALQMPLEDIHTSLSQNVPGEMGKKLGRIGGGQAGRI